MQKPSKMQSCQLESIDKSIGVLNIWWKVYYTETCFVCDLGYSSDEEQFEVGADGKIRLKPGKKKINLDKLTDEELRRLGIDPSLSKKEIAKILKVRYNNRTKLLILYYTT